MEPGLIPPLEMQQHSLGAPHGAASSRTVTTGFGDDPSSRLGLRPTPSQKQHDEHKLSPLEQLLKVVSYSPAVTDLLLEQQLQHHQHAAHAAVGPLATTDAADADFGPPCYVPASYLASWMQQQQQPPPAAMVPEQPPLQAAAAGLQTAANEVQCNNEQPEDIMMSSSLSYGAASMSVGSMQPLQRMSPASPQQAKSSQLLWTTSSEPAQRCDPGQRKGSSSRTGCKRVQAHAKLQLQYKAKLAEYDQLKAEQQGLLMDQGLVLGMIQVMEQVLRVALNRAFGCRAAAAAHSNSVAGPAPPSVCAAATAAAEMLQKALAMEQQVEQLMAEQQRLLECVPATAAAEAAVPCGGALLGSLLSEAVSDEVLQVSASDWPHLCKVFVSSVSLLLHMLPSPTAGARAAAQLHSQHTQHLQRQLALMLRDPQGWLRTLGQAAQQLQARQQGGESHLLAKVAPTPQQAELLRRLAALHGEMQGQLRRRLVLLHRPLAAAAGMQGGCASSAAGGGTTAHMLGLLLGGGVVVQHLADTQQQDVAAAQLGRVLRMQVTLWGAAAHQCLALLSEKQTAMAFVSCHPHALDPLLLSGLAADAAAMEASAADAAAGEMSIQG